ncbi:MAG: hypothetical protein J0G29_06870 [Alphaproteobacteria bacterium]|nr:hypothetical protein [Alphaproteobacteria bacterium]OJV45348.1 MAG: hypothetical protein BGO28_00900 [Alphaproteobacteria bacterium 43-37]
MTYNNVGRVAAMMMVIGGFFFSLKIANAQVDKDEFLPDVRRGLFLHFCDTLHKSTPSASVDGIEAEFNLGHLKNSPPLNKALHQCRMAYDIEVKARQDKQIRNMSIFETFYDMYRRGWHGKKPITADERASVSVLSNEDGSRFMLTTADEGAYKIFSHQNYDRQSAVDQVWPSVSNALRELSPDLLSAWREYSLRVKEGR